MSDPRAVLDDPGTPPDATVTYGPLPEHVADLWWPADRERPASLVVVVHGGFWRSEFDRLHTRAQCAGLVAAGFAVAAVEYRRTGQEGGGWPGTFEDVDAALRSLPRLVVEAAAAAGGVRLDLDRTVLLGHSAGGHLAAWAATRGYPGVHGAVSLAGVLDLRLAHELALDPEPGGPAVHLLLGGTPDDVPERYAEADPTRLGTPAVPVVAVHGDADRTVPVALSRSYASATGQALVVLPDVEHFAVIDPTSAAWPHVLEQVRAAAAPTPG
ncbi:alpha/beta hydrolase [Angustibacter peucedani]